MSKRLSFVDSCVSGAGRLDDIDDHIDAWHDSDGKQPLWKYLGMSHDEYKLWFERPESLRSIIKAHRENRSVVDVIRSLVDIAGNLGAVSGPRWAAARADDPEEAEKLFEWLAKTGRLD